MRISPQLRKALLEVTRSPLVAEKKGAIATKLTSQSKPITDLHELGRLRGWLGAFDWLEQMYNSPDSTKEET